MLTRTPNVFLTVSLTLATAGACAGDDEPTELQRQLDLTPDPALAGSWEPVDEGGPIYEFDVDGQWASIESGPPDAPEQPPTRTEGMFGGDGHRLRIVVPFSLDVPGGYSGYTESNDNYHVDGDLLSMYVVRPEGAVDGVVGTFTRDDRWLFVGGESDRLENHLISTWSFAADGTFTQKQSWQSEGTVEDHDHAGTYQVTDEGVRVRFAGESDDLVLYWAGDGLTYWRWRRAPSSAE